MDEGMAAATAAASGIGNTYVYYCTVKPLNTLLTEINNPNITFPYTLQLTSDVSNHTELDENHLFAAIEINNDEIIKTRVYDKEDFKKVYALHTLNPRSNVSAANVSAANVSAEPVEASAMVTPGHPAASRGPVAEATAEAIGAAPIVAPVAADEDLAAAEEKSVEASAAAYSNEELRRITGEYTNYEFRIGMHSTTYSGGWRMATATEWKDRTFQAALILAHRKDSGWLLLEESLNCNYTLCVADGSAMIDNTLIIEVGHDIDNLHNLENKYIAMNSNTKTSWNITEPNLGSGWNIGEMYSRENCPCLFVKRSNPQPNSAVGNSPAVAVAAAAVAAAADPIIQPVSLSNEELQRIADIPQEVKFAIGYHSNKYPGWTEVRRNSSNILNEIKQYYLTHNKFIHLVNINYKTYNLLAIYDGIILIKTNTNYSTYIIRNKAHNNEYIIDTTLMKYINNNWLITSLVNPSTLKDKPCLFMRIPKK